jgi:ATP-dependent DNA ligase
MPHQRTEPTALGVKAPFPGFIEPALATKIGKVPSGERWIHEIKFDGYRANFISLTKRTRYSPDAATIGPSVFGRSRPTPI